MKIECLVAEIGSTTTVVNAFGFTPVPRFIGRGIANTTVSTDVREGLNKAISQLEDSLGTPITYDRLFATSSAAGGLRMTVSGLVYDMTVKAAQEAALNAGANVHFVTSGDLEADDLETIKKAEPNIVLVSGGTDYGDKRTAYENIKKIEALKLNVPIVYAGNKENGPRIEKHFKASDQKEFLIITENVYPRVDFMNIHPLRRVIYKTFEENITKAKGMQYIRTQVNGSIMPTPGAVMESTMILSRHLGNVMVIDVGGATTDVHSISVPREEYEDFMEGEPLEKRTVEGDLGVFVNAENVWSQLDKEVFKQEHRIDESELQSLKDNYTYMPETPLQRAFVRELSRICVFKALDRHVGNLKNVYTSSGRKVIPDGRDLSRVQYIILTGGALINLDDTESMVREYIRKRPNRMMPDHDVTILKDHDYVMAAGGVLSLEYLGQATQILQQSLRLEGKDDVSET
ncbi:MAG: glutamate mutase L [Candidatus Izemoplasmataceae bacterium]